MAHVLPYDLNLHTHRRESRLQDFAPLGGGLKIFRGRGAEAAYQPLSQYGYFTKTQTVKPLASGGAGPKYAINNLMFLRTDFAIT